MVNVLDKDKILWYVMRAYKNENTAEDRLSNETYGLEYFTNFSATLPVNVGIGLI